MTWSVGQIAWYQGKIGTVLKVHTADHLLAVLISANNARGWPINHCLPVDQKTTQWKTWTLGQTIYYGINGLKSTIVGWSVEADTIIILTEDRYEAVVSDEIATTSHTAQRLAWFKRWIVEETRVTETKLAEWRHNDQWAMIALYWEFVATQHPLTRQESLQMASAWRKNGKTIHALHIYQTILRTWPDSEPFVLAGTAGCYRDLNNLELAKTVYRDLQQRYPKTRHQASAALGLSGIAHDEGNLKSAKSWYDEAVRLDPSIDLQKVPKMRAPSITKCMSKEAIDRLVANPEDDDEVPSLDVFSGIYTQK